MQETVIKILLISGSFFAFAGAIGVLRLPDVYMRLSATAKAATLGTSFILGAAALYFEDSAISGKIAAIIAFLVFTAPVAAHMIGRAAYFSNVPLWEGTVCDELGRPPAACESGPLVSKSSKTSSGI
jgi:multicomponent Na+:H+ antiporter subunit G